MPDEAETEANMGVFLRAALQDPARLGLPRGPLAAAGAWLLHWAPAWLYDLVWRCTLGASPFPAPLLRIHVAKPQCDCAGKCVHPGGG